MPISLTDLFDNDMYLRLVVTFLDVFSMGKLSSVNTSFREKCEPLWFVYAQNLFRRLKHDEMDTTTGGESLADIGKDDSGVDWKEAVAFCYRHNLSGLAFKDHMSDFILTLAAREVGTSVHCSGAIDANPDLYVPGAGMQLSWPLQPKQLHQLIDDGYCEQAPIGRGEETILDLNTRKGRRLMLGKDVIIGNSNWNAVLTRAGFQTDSPLHEIQEKLMPHWFGKGDVWAQPYCMLIYEEGDFFKPHRDTLRGPNHFGSLIISLPVEGGCSGGNFVLTHSSSSSEEHRSVATYVPVGERDSCKYVAFYTDIFHQVQEVTSGYRVALNYHLWAVPSKSIGSVIGNVPRPMPSAADEKTTSMLKSLFKHGVEKHFNYHALDSSPHRFVFPLDHKYGYRTLSLSTLRGRDSIHYSVLKELDNSDVDVDLEIMRVETFSKPEDPTKYQVMSFVEQDEEGCKADTDQISRKTLWLNQERFLSMEHDFSEYEYYTGNEGYTAGFQYKHAIIVIEPCVFAELHAVQY